MKRITLKTVVSMVWILLLLSVASLEFASAGRPAGYVISAHLYGCPFFLNVNSKRISSNRPCTSPFFLHCISHHLLQPFACTHQHYHEHRVTWALIHLNSIFPTFILTNGGKEGRKGKRKDEDEEERCCGYQTSASYFLLVLFCLFLFSFFSPSLLWWVRIGEKTHHFLWQIFIVTCEVVVSKTSACNGSK